MDYILKRPCDYCPKCGAVALVEEKKYKELLDKKGCNQINRDFDEIHTVVANDKPYYTCLTLHDAIDMASNAVECGYTDVIITNEDGDDIELDICLLLQ